MTPPSILVLYNEPVLPLDHPDAGSEHDILDTMANTARVLEAAGFAVRRLGINFNPQPLLDELRDHRPDAVFNLFEGIATQTATEVAVAAMLEWLNIPFTGSPSPCLSLGRDKIRTKHLLSAAGLCTPDYLVIDRSPVPKWGRGWPAIVKPACQDASVGIDQGSVVTTQRQFEQRVRHVLKTYGPPVLAERFVHGREFHVNVIENGPGDDPHRPVIVLPLAEIGFEHTNPDHWPIYTFTAKWDMDSDEYKATPLRTRVELPEEADARLRDLAARAFHLLQCRDYARLDVRMSDDGAFHILELNPNPYLDSQALIIGLDAIGRTHERLIVDLALGAIARGGKAVPAGAITVPVGVSAAARHVTKLDSHARAESSRRGRQRGHGYIRVYVRPRVRWHLLQERPAQRRCRRAGPHPRGAGPRPAAAPPRGPQGGRGGRVPQCPHETRATHGPRCRGVVCILQPRLCAPHGRGRRR